MKPARVIRGRRPNCCRWSTSNSARWRRGRCARSGRTRRFRRRRWCTRRTCGSWTRPRCSSGKAAGTSSRRRRNRCGASSSTTPAAAGRIKRGGELNRVDLDKLELTVDDPPDELIALDEALTELAEQHPEKAQLVNLRYFGGLTHEEAAQRVGISISTADRHWAYARAWLYRRMAVGGSRPQLVTSEETIFAEALGKGSAPERGRVPRRGLRAATPNCAATSKRCCSRTNAPAASSKPRPSAST